MRALDRRLHFVEDLEDVAVVHAQARGDADRLWRELQLLTRRTTRGKKQQARKQRLEVRRHGTGRARKEKEERGNVQGFDNVLREFAELVFAVRDVDLGLLRRKLRTTTTTHREGALRKFTGRGEGVEEASPGGKLRGFINCCALPYLFAREESLYRRRIRPTCPRQR